MSETARPDRRLRILLALALALGVLVALLVAGISAWPSVLRSQVIQRALAQGVELEPGSLSFRRGELRISDSRFRLVGVQGLDGRAEEVVVTLDGTRPTNLEARGVRIEATGDAPQMTLQVFDWMRAHATPARVPLRAHGVGTIVRAKVDEPPWLRLEGGDLDSSELAWRLRASRAIVLSTTFEPVVASWNQGDKHIAIAVRGEDASAPIRLEVSRDKPLSAKAQWKPMALKEIGDMIGVRVSSRPITIAGKAALEWLPGGAVEGSAKLELTGFVPPHPRELDGMLFGDKTTVDTRFVLMPDRTSMTLSEVKSVAGAFVLTGSGKGRRAGNTATVDLQLTGPVACSALANSAARGRLGGLIGGLVGNLAKRTLTGTLSVSVGIHADLARVEAARVEPSLSGRCGVNLLP